jgi:hypothetical protein
MTGKTIGHEADYIASGNPGIPWSVPEITPTELNNIEGETSPGEWRKPRRHAIQD